MVYAARTNWAINCVAIWERKILKKMYGPIKREERTEHGELESTKSYSHYKDNGIITDTGYDF